MLFHYIKSSWRNIRRNKMFSAINIIGLSMGIAVSFVILLFIHDELSYDGFHTNADNIYRIVFNASTNGGKINESNVMPPVAATLVRDFPEVEAAVRLHTDGKPTIGYQGKIFKEAEMAFADSNFFRFFSFPLVSGSINDVLARPNSLVLNETAARKIFGNENPVGKTIEYNRSGIFTVTGVMKDMPSNSHFHFDLIGSMSSLNSSRSESWMFSGFFTYLQLKPGSNYKLLEVKFPAMVEKYIGPQIAQEMGMSLSKFRTKGNELGFALQPLRSIHLQSQSSSELEPGGDMRYVYICGAIAAFMLLIASINFINLSTAGAGKRAKEVGIRKVLGSGKAQLVQQFLFESILISLLAVLLSAAIVQLSLPLFNQLSDKSLHFGMAPLPLLVLLGISLAVGGLAGIYPAFFLSSFMPTKVLKGTVSGRFNKLGLRSGLVVFQFFISVTLIVATIVVYEQMKFIRETKLGYNKEHVLVIPNSGLLGHQETVFRDALRREPGVVDVTVSGYKPAGPTYQNNAMAYPAGKEDQVTKTLEYNIDEHYLSTLGIALAAGRNFSPAMPTDSSAMIINEAAARVFGFENDAIGKQIVRVNGVRGNNYAYTVIGVVKDFHFRSLHEAISPLLMVLNPEQGLIVRVAGSNTPALLANFQKKWDAFSTGEPFTYNFLDDLYNKTYAAEQKTGTILNIFSLLTIFVACMGLFGLATHTAEQRAREIGIRKVLGASAAQVTGLLSADFLKLVLIGSVFAFPVSWWAMHAWLNDFAYRIHFSPWFFVIAAIIAIILALVTVSVKAVGAALRNPVKTLRSE